VGRQIAAVVFDVGQVLVRWDLRFLFAKLIDDPDELDWFLTNIVTPDWHLEIDSGLDLDLRVAERKRQFPGHDALIDAYATRYVETIPGRVAGMAELVEQLAGQRVPLYAITNFGAAFWEQFHPTEPLLDLFADIVVSGKEKVMKPDPAIFKLAAQRFGHVPEEMLFIDDCTANIASAAALGWQVHHFVGAQGLAEDLLARGLIT